MGGLDMKTVLWATFFAVGIALQGTAIAQGGPRHELWCARKSAKRTNGQASSHTLKGEVATVDEASGKISVKLSGTAGSSDATTPTYFKVEDALVFNAVKPGDQVSFTAERKGEEEMTITKLVKQ